MKKLLSCIFLIIFSFQFVSAEEEKSSKKNPIEFTEGCKYADQANTCFEAIKNLTYKTIWWKNNPSEPICVSHNDSDFILMNIILDTKFKKTDKKAKEFIRELEVNRKKYFSTDLTYLDAFQDINEKFGIWWDLWQEYSSYCNWWKWEPWILNELNSCIKWWYSSQSITDFFSTSSKTQNKCLAFAEHKLAIYRFTASQILKINKWQIWRDDNKKLMKKQRGLYDKLLDKFIANVRYLDWILKWLPNITSNVK